MLDRLGFAKEPCIMLTVRLITERNKSTDNGKFPRLLGQWGVSKELCMLFWVFSCLNLSQRSRCPSKPMSKAEKLVAGRTCFASFRVISPTPKGRSHIERLSYKFWLCMVTERFSSHPGCIIFSAPLIQGPS